MNGLVQVGARRVHPLHAVHDAGEDPVGGKDDEGAEA